MHQHQIRKLFKAMIRSFIVVISFGLVRENQGPDLYLKSRYRQFMTYLKIIYWKNKSKNVDSFNFAKINNDGTVILTNMQQFSWPTSTVFFPYLLRYSLPTSTVPLTYLQLSSWPTCNCPPDLPATILLTYLQLSSWPTCNWPPVLPATVPLTYPQLFSIHQPSLLAHWSIIRYVF